MGFFSKVNPRFFRKKQLNMNSALTKNQKHIDFLKNPRKSYELMAF